MSAEAGAGEVTLTVSRPGATLVRIPWSPWLGLVNGEGEVVARPSGVGRNVNGCLRPSAPRPSQPPAQVTAPGEYEPGPRPGHEGPAGEDSADGATSSSEGDPLGILASGEYDDRNTDRWTVLEAPRAGTYRIAAPYRLPRGTPCA
ncbi:hypothetical protein N566_01735 [Streptomycetaceae bacterium MP113-05]|nr:hypothetical protein N566_01735 [Streptomycetaceae bacterium MP113-05]